MPIDVHQTVIIALVVASEQARSELHREHWNERIIVTLQPQKLKTTKQSCKPLGCRGIHSESNAFKLDAVAADSDRERKGLDHIPVGQDRHAAGYQDAMNLSDHLLLPFQRQMSHRPEH